MADNEELRKLLAAYQDANPVEQEPEAALEDELLLEEEPINVPAPIAEVPQVEAPMSAPTPEAPVEEIPVEAMPEVSPVPEIAPPQQDKAEELQKLLKRSKALEDQPYGEELGDEALKSAQRDAKIDRLVNNAANAARMLSGADPSAHFREQAKMADQPVRDLMQRRKAKDADMARERAAHAAQLEEEDKREQADPNSLVSEVYRNAAAQFGLQVPEGTSAAALEKVLPMQAKVQAAAMAKRKIDSGDMTEYQKQAVEARKRQLDLAEKKFEHEASQPVEIKESAFEKEYSKAQGKAAVDYLNKDKPLLVANRRKIDSAIEILESGDDVSGTLVGNTPDTILSAVNPKAIEVKESMQSAIMDTLRPTLGAQFTENEGKRIMNLAYNPKLGEEVNKKRALELKRVIQDKIKFQDALYAHLRSNNGSDQGFDYSKYNMSKSDSAPSDKQAPAADTVRMQSPDGKIRLVPQDKVEAALKAGGKLME